MMPKPNMILGGDMSAALKWNLVSVDDYLAGELESPMKHEYLGGVVYAMAGARNTHNTIAGNTFARLHLRLRISNFLTSLF